MKKDAPPTRLLILKAICIALTLTFGASLFATGVLANSGCKLKCCCQSNPMTGQHNPGKQMRAAMGCCNGTPLTPCDLVFGTQLELPDITLSSSGGHPLNAVGSTQNLSDSLIDRHGFRGNDFDQFAREIFRPPPLYLQNLSFLI